MILLHLVFMIGSSWAIIPPSRFINFDKTAPSPNIIGAKSSFNSNYFDFAIISTTQDGVLNTSFGINQATPGIVIQSFGSNAVAESVAITHDNKIIAGGFYNASTGTTASTAVVNNMTGMSTVPNVTSFALAKFNPDGSLDQTFNPLGKYGPAPGLVVTSFTNNTDILTGLFLDSHERIVTVGTSIAPSSIVQANTTGITVARYNTDGSLDATFGNNGFETYFVTNMNNYVNGLTIDANQNIILVGDQQDPNAISPIGDDTVTDLLVVRLGPAGNLDTTFNAQGTMPGFFVFALPNATITGYAVMIDNNQKIVISGVALLFATVDGDTEFSFELVTIRLNPDGTLDKTFNAEGATPGYVLSTIPNLVISLSSGVLQNFQIVSSLDIDKNGTIIVSAVTSGKNIDSGFSSNENDFYIAFYPQETVLDNVVVNQGVLLTTSSGPSLAFTFNPDVTSGVLVDSQQRDIFGGYSNDNNTQNFYALIRTEPETVTLDPTFDPTSILPGTQILNLFQTNTELASLGSGGPDTTTAQRINLGFLSQELARKDALYLIEPEILVPLPETVIDQRNYTIMGKAPAGYTVYLYVDDQFTQMIRPDGSNHWSYLLSNLSDGSHRLSLVTVDPLGTSSKVSAGLEFFVATQKIPAPMITLPKPRSVVSEKSFTISGTALPSVSVLIYINGSYYDETISSDEGAWSLELSDLPDGSYSLTAKALNAAGHISESSGVVELTQSYEKSIGRTAQPLPVMITYPLTQSVLATRELSIKGSGPAGKFISLTLNDKPLASVKADVHGVWQYVTSVLKDGRYTLAASYKDEKGKPYVAPGVVVTVTTKALPAAKINKLQARDIQSNTLLISGRAERGSRVTLYLNSRPIDTTVADKRGQWRYELDRDRLVGAQTFTIGTLVTDKAGNRSSFSSLVLSV